ncbi:MAG: DoxX family protein [Bacteroidota bacterium]
MKQLIFKTDDNWASVVLRMIFGIIMMIHALPKLSSEGYHSFIYFFTQYLQLPVVMAWATIFVEVVGSLCLILGLATRISAVMLFGLFIGMIAFVHWENGFLMNWNGQMEAGQEGFEYHLLVLAICGTLTILGGGKLSTDQLIGKKLNR